jgi:hypothetical protein
MQSEQSATPRARRRWLLIGGVAAVGLIAVSVAIFRPQYSTIRVSSGESYDIIQIGRDDGVGALFSARAQGAGPALLVNYYARVGDLQEAQRLHEYAIPIADSAGLRLIVVSQTTPTVTRWLPLVRGQMWAWRRWGAGNWRRVEQ